MGKAIKDVDIDDSAFSKIESMIHSMTPYERANPPAINGSRKKRIAEGSGHDIQDVNAFMKQFEDMRKMMKTMTKLGSMGRSMSNIPGLKR
jgi:signal recognition particle subunit SRP54